jgi:hypothetical protein
MTHRAHVWAVRTPMWLPQWYVHPGGSRADVRAVQVQVRPGVLMSMSVVLQ